MAINTQKVVVGGLAAGVVLTALDYVVNGVLLAQQGEEAMSALNPDLAANMQSTSMIVSIVVIDFLLAILLVWTYAAMRPRFGAGPKTAFIAALQLWIFGDLLMGFFAASGMFTWGFYALNALTTLVIFQIAVQVGARVYSEGQA